MPRPRPVVLVARLLDAAAGSRGRPEWPPFAATLAERLGAQTQGGLLVTPFEDVPAACRAWEAEVVGAWAQRRGPAAETCPIQGLLDLAASWDARTPVPEDASRWHHIWPGLLHFTTDLEAQWVGLGGRELGGLIETLPDAADLARLQPPGGGDAPRLDLFPPAVTAPPGGARPCFYCGSARHRPASCPSKHLAPELYALPALAEDTLRDLHRCWPESTIDPPALSVERLREAGPDSVRRDPVLRAFVARLDLDRTYQLRFLWYLTFSQTQAWPVSGPLGAVHASGAPSLRRGLDCLRVGQHDEALASFHDRSSRTGRRWFYAEVGTALVAVERDDLAGALVHLHRSLRLAETPTERFYAHLLVARCHEVVGDVAGAEAAFLEAGQLNLAAADLVYRQLRLRARSGPVPEAADWVRRVAEENGETFARAMIDPALRDAVPELEAVLASLWESSRRRARRGVDRARAACDALADWFGPDCEDLTGPLRSLELLEARLARHSYGDDLEVTRGADRVAAAAHLLKLRGVQRLRRQWASTREVFVRLARSWEGYPYPRFFPRFGATLAEVRRELLPIPELLKRETAPSCRRVAELLAAVESPLERLAATEKDLLWVRRLAQGSVAFARHLAVAEVLAVVLGIAVPALVLGRLPASTGWAALVAARPALPRIWSALLCTVLAPAAAFGTSSRRLRRTRGAGGQRGTS